MGWIVQAEGLKRMARRGRACSVSGTAREMTDDDADAWRVQIRRTIGREGERELLQTRSRLRGRVREEYIS